jgi:hypothetical protein
VNRILKNRNPRSTVTPSPVEVIETEFAEDI